MCYKHCACRRDIEITRDKHLLFNIYNKHGTQSNHSEIIRIVDIILDLSFKSKKIRASKTLKAKNVTN